MKRIRFYLALLATVLIIPFIRTNALEFSDIDRSFAKSSIQKWSNRGVISGDRGKFMPDKSVTRGELAVILNRIFHFKNTSAKIHDFKDLKESFYTDSILALYDQKILVGHDGYLRAEDFITREESATVLLRAFQISGISEPIKFEDSEQISNWAKNSLSYMTKNKFMNGYQNKLSPKQYITRAEFVKILDNLVIDYIEDNMEYDASKIKNTAGVLIVNSRHATIKNLKSDVEILSTSSNKSIDFGQSQIHFLKLLGEDKKEIKLTDTSISNIKNDAPIEIQVDKKSSLPNYLQENVRILPLSSSSKKDSKLKDVTGGGYTDEYQPILPDKPIVEKKEEQSIKPQQAFNTNLCIITENTKDDGKVHLDIQDSAITDFTLPDRSLIVNKQNGENSGKSISLKWENADVSDIRSKKAGEYKFYAIPEENFHINEIYYQAPRLEFIVIVQ